jgi:DNA-binding NarL/FixJ family response regulator
MVKSSNKKPVEPSTLIQIVLASRSKIFLEGMCKILECEGDIKIVAETLTYKETLECLADVEFEFLLIDNVALNLDAGGLSNLICKKDPDTKIILLDNQNKDKINLPGVIYVTKETDSSELICIIKRTGQSHHVPCDKGGIYTL